MKEIIEVKKPEAHENFFKFGIYQEKDPIVERIFSADLYNQTTRYFIDIRDMLFDIIKRTEKVMSKNKQTYIYDSYNFVKYYKKISEKYYKDQPSKLDYPEIKSVDINGKTFKGSELKIGLYINDNPIVERVLYIKNYQPSARFSKEIVGLVNIIVEEIKKNIRDLDINQMWDDYNIINYYGLHIQKVRELSQEKRRKYLDRIYNK
ncbi:MAG: hypothetical protein ACOC33_01330 [bacterium]